MVPDNNSNTPLNVEEFRQLLEFGIERLSEELSRVNHTRNVEQMTTVKRYILATLADIDNALGRWGSVR